MREYLRIIRYRRYDAARNMALDEALAEAQREPDAVPTLRFYGWDKPAASIGYFQDPESAARLLRADREGLDIVRRLTGGGAVRHGEDLTFSIQLKLPTRFFPTNVKDSYLKINEIVRTALADRVPGLDYADCRSIPSQKQRQKERVCFEEPACHDLLLAGKKVLGASQRRLGEVFLHQSSLQLPIETARLESVLIEAFCRGWGIEGREMSVRPEEEATAARILTDRYGRAEWFRSSRSTVSS